MAEIVYRSQISMLAEPTKDEHVATKKYVDDNAVEARVSDDSGNIIEKRADGLFAQCTTLVWGINIAPASSNTKWGVY